MTEREIQERIRSLSEEGRSLERKTKELRGKLLDIRREKYELMQKLQYLGDHPEIKEVQIYRSFDKGEYR